MILQSHRELDGVSKTDGVKRCNVNSSMYACNYGNCLGFHFEFYDILYKKLVIFVHMVVLTKWKASHFISMLKYKQYLFDLLA